VEIEFDGTKDGTEEETSMGLSVSFSTGFLVGLYLTNVGEIDDGIMVGIDGVDV